MIALLLSAALALEPDPDDALDPSAEPAAEPESRLAADNGPRVAPSSIAQEFRADPQELADMLAYLAEKEEQRGPTVTGYEGLKV